MRSQSELRQQAISLFEEVIRKIEARKSVLDALRLNAGRLSLADYEVELDRFPSVYSIAVGKAAHGMATALTEVLGSRFTAGVLSGPPVAFNHDDRWRTFTGGHPQPNQESFNAGAAALGMLRKAGSERALVIFLVSGGGSAMIEWPRTPGLLLEDFVRTNRILTSSGAPIKEVNRIRARVSEIKNGGLSRAAHGATQMSLLISDTNPGDETLVASGPSLFSEDLADTTDLYRILDEYELRRGLPESVLNYLEKGIATRASVPRHPYSVLLSNQSAIEAAARTARSQGMQVAVADDVIDGPVGIGVRTLISRLRELRNRTERDRTVCLISGGEFDCRVMGRGIGGRNSEASLRAAIEMDQNDREMVVLNAGTDGIDGNSPAAGALADESTLTRAAELGLDANRFLENSDSFSLFQALGDSIVTGQTGTNVRDIRIYLAR